MKLIDLQESRLAYPNYGQWVKDIIDSYSYREGQGIFYPEEIGQKRFGLVDVEIVKRAKKN